MKEFIVYEVSGGDSVRARAKSRNLPLERIQLEKPALYAIMEAVPLLEIRHFGSHKVCPIAIVAHSTICATSGRYFTRNEVEEYCAKTIKMTQ